MKVSAQLEDSITLMPLPEGCTCLVGELIG